MNWRDLQQQVNKGKHEQFYLLYGEDEWQISQAIKALVQLIPAETHALNLIRVSGRNLKPSDLDQYQQISLFGEERILIIEEPRFLRSARRREEEDVSSKDSGDDTAWEKSLEMLSQELLLILVHPGNLDRRRRLTKWLEKKATLVDCAPLKRGEMLKLIQAQLSEHRLQVEYGVAERIQEIAGDAPGIAVSEINKLSIAFPGARRLSMQEAQTVLSASVDAEVFSLFDLLTELKLKEAFGLLDELLRRGEAAPRIIASVARQLRQMLQVRALEQRGQRGNTAARQLGLHAYHLQRLSEKAAMFTDEQLVGLLVDCCAKDSRMKSGRIGMSTGLDLVLLQMATMLKSRRLMRTARR